MRETDWGQAAAIRAVHGVARYGKRERGGEHEGADGEVGGGGDGAEGTEGDGAGVLEAQGALVTSGVVDEWRAGSRLVYSFHEPLRLICLGRMRDHYGLHCGREVNIRSVQESRRKPEVGGLEMEKLIKASFVQTSRRFRMCRADLFQSVGGPTMTGDAVFPLPPPLEL